MRQQLTIYPLKTHMHRMVEQRQQRRRRQLDDVVGLLPYELKSTVHGIVEL